MAAMRRSASMAAASSEARSGRRGGPTSGQTYRIRAARPSSSPARTSEARRSGWMPPSNTTEPSNSRRAELLAARPSSGLNPKLSSTIRTASVIASSRGGPSAASTAPATTPRRTPGQRLQPVPHRHAEVGRPAELAGFDLHRQHRVSSDSAPSLSRGERLLGVGEGGRGEAGVGACGMRPLPRANCIAERSRPSGATGPGRGPGRCPCGRTRRPGGGTPCRPPTPAADLGRVERCARPRPPRPERAAVRSAGRRSPPSSASPSSVERAAPQHRHDEQHLPPPPFDRVPVVSRASSRRR